MLASLFALITYKTNTTNMVNIRLQTDHNEHDENDYYSITPMRKINAESILRAMTTNNEICTISTTKDLSRMKKS
jgi:hypothetical protein